MKSRYWGLFNFMSRVFFVVLTVSLITYNLPLNTEAQSLGQSEGGAYGNTPLQARSVGVNPQQVDKATKSNLQETYGKLPLYFIQNDGQMNEKVRFYEKGSGHSTFFTQDGVYLSLIPVNRQNTEDHGQKAASAIDDMHTQSPKPGISDAGPSTSNSQLTTAELVKLLPLGANKNPEIVAEGLQEGKVNYFTGNDPEKWKTNIPTYQAVVYQEIYKNIDMKFYGNNRQLEYDIIVKPGANPSRIQLSYQGIEDLKVTEDGHMEIILKHGKVVQKRPYIYQEIDGKRVEIEGKFRVLSSEFGVKNQKSITCGAQSRTIRNSSRVTRHPSLVYGFQVASYDKRYPLIIDPILMYSTYLGGTVDQGIGIAVDGSGNAYVTGHTNSLNFPTASAYQGSFAGVSDAFVTKFNATGDALMYSTYLGGGDYDRGNDIAVDNSGNAYVTGRTASTNFPTAFAYQGSFAGVSDTFVTKFNATGDALMYSTYLGGYGEDEGLDIAVDGSGNAYVTGGTDSPNFPTASAYQGSNAGRQDAFVTKFNATGSDLMYSTYLGGETKQMKV